MRPGAAGRRMKSAAAAAAVAAAAASASQSVIIYSPASRTFRPGASGQYLWFEVRVSRCGVRGVRGPPRTNDGRFDS